MRRPHLRPVFAVFTLVLCAFSSGTAPARAVAQTLPQKKLEFRGLLRDAAGNPIANADVLLQNHFWVVGKRPAPLKLQSDGAGRFAAQIETPQRTDGNALWERAARARRPRRRTTTPRRPSTPTASTTSHGRWRRSILSAPWRCRTKSRRRDGKATAISTRAIISSRGCSIPMRSATRSVSSGPAAKFWIQRGVGYLL